MLKTAVISYYLYIKNYVYTITIFNNSENIDFDKIFIQKSFLQNR